MLWLPTVLPLIDGVSNLLPTTPSPALIENAVLTLWLIILTVIGMGYIRSVASDVSVRDAVRSILSARLSVLWVGVNEGVFAAIVFSEHHLLPANGFLLFGWLLLTVGIHGRVATRVNDPIALSEVPTLVTARLRNRIGVFLLLGGAYTIGTFSLFFADLAFTTGSRTVFVFGLASILMLLLPSITLFVVSAVMLTPVPLVYARAAVIDQAQ